MSGEAEKGEGARREKILGCRTEQMRGEKERFCAICA